MTAEEMRKVADAVEDVNVCDHTLDDDDMLAGQEAIHQAASLLRTLADVRERVEKQEDSALRYSEWATGVNNERDAIAALIDRAEAKGA